MPLYAKIYACDGRRDALSVIPADKHEVCVLNALGPFEPKSGDACVILEKRAGVVRAVPCDADGNKVPDVMFGGRYVACSDSRFSRAVEAALGAPFYGAVALHDRREY